MEKRERERKDDNYESRKEKFRIIEKERRQHQSSLKLKENKYMDNRKLREERAERKYKSRMNKKSTKPFNNRKTFL